MRAGRARVRQACSFTGVNFSAVGGLARVCPTSQQAGAERAGGRQERDRTATSVAGIAGLEVLGGGLSLREPLQGLGGLRTAIEALQSGGNALIEGLLLGTGLLLGLGVWSVGIFRLVDGRGGGLQAGATKMAAALNTADHLVARDRVHQGTGNLDLLLTKDGCRSTGARPGNETLKILLAVHG